MLKSTKVLKRESFIPNIYRRNSISLFQWLFIEWNCIKTEKQEVKFWKLPLYSLEKWRLTEVLNIYLFKIFLQNSLMIHLWTIVSLWSTEKCSNTKKCTNPMDSERCERGMEINVSGNFMKSFIMEITMQTYSPETRLLNWTFKKIVSIF